MSYPKKSVGNFYKNWEIENVTFLWNGITCNKGQYSMSQSHTDENSSEFTAFNHSIFGTINAWSFLKLSANLLTHALSVMSIKLPSVKLSCEVAELS